MLHRVQADQLSPSPDFPAGVGSLMKRLRTILIDTEQMKLYEHDPEMLIDLQYRVADSYSNAPELRITWLESMARIHIAQGNWSEAAMCVVHGAGIVAERLRAQGGELESVLRNGCAIFKPISRNVSGEKYISWQSAEGGSAGQGSGISNGNRGTLAQDITSPLFTKHGLIRLLRSAVYLLRKAERYELVSPIYSVLMPILEQARRYGALAEACSDMQDCFGRILQLKETNRRHLGTFFRVGFYGKLFSGMDGRQFIYKEPNVTPLASISLRLKALFEMRFGRGKVEMVTDSKEVDRSKLDPNKAHMQITYVEPNFDDLELPFRQTYFEQNHNNFAFSFDTPFTRSGKAHGAVGDQCMRVTVLEVPKAFPYIKKRCVVIPVVLSALSCVRLFVCACAFPRATGHIRIHLHTCIHAYTQYAHTNLHTSVHQARSADTHMHMPTRIHMHTRTRTYTYAYMHLAANPCCSRTASKCASPAPSSWSRLMWRLWR